jgi:hypothetical protein
MNNYSWLQQKLHKLALSSQFMRESMFDVEKAIFVSRDYQDIENHVFIAGLARSGTTALLNAIYQSGKFASLSYADMPFVLAPNLWSKLGGRKNHSPLYERAHKDGIQIATDSPEAFEEIFWETFDDDSNDRTILFKKYVGLILRKYKKRRYLSKNNQNIRRLADIHNIFPKAKVLIPFRDPIQHANSLLLQHKIFTEVQKKDKFTLDYMNWIGHSEFGQSYRPIISSNLKYQDNMTLNHWLEQWYLVYKQVTELSIGQESFSPICYESLCNDLQQWKKIKELIDIDQSIVFKFTHSKKIIDEDFDEALLKRCSNIYADLSH